MISRFALLLLLLFAAPALADSPGPVTFGHSEVGIATAGGASFHFAVEVAETPDQLHQGLMFRDAMAEDAGTEGGCGCWAPARVVVKAKSRNQATERIFISLSFYSFKFYISRVTILNALNSSGNFQLEVRNEFQLSYLYQGDQ